MLLEKKRGLITNSCPSMENIIIGGSGLINSSFNIISQQLDIDKIYSCAKDPHKAKHQLLITK